MHTEQPNLEAVKNIVISSYYKHWCRTGLELTHRTVAHSLSASTLEQRLKDGDHDEQRLGLDGSFGMEEGLWPLYGH